MVILAMLYFIAFILMLLAMEMNFLSFTFENIISLFTLLGAWIGGAFAFNQWRDTNKLKKAEYINALTEKIRSDEDMKDTIYLFDYGENWYGKKIHGNTELELKIDKTLSYFSYICYLKNRKIISNKEFSFFRYEIKRILNNENTQSYLFNVYHFARKNDTEMTFKYLFEYGKKIGVFDKSFYDVNSKEYRVYLNIH